MDRGIRLALDGERPIAHIARDLGIEPESSPQNPGQFNAPTARGHQTRHKSSFRTWPDLLNSSWGQPEPLSGQTTPREERPATQPDRQPILTADRW